MYIQSIDTPDDRILYNRQQRQPGWPDIRSTVQQLRRDRVDPRMVRRHARVETRLRSTTKFATCSARQSRPLRPSLRPPTRSRSKTATDGHPSPRQTTGSSHNSGANRSNGDSRNTSNHAPRPTSHGQSWSHCCAAYPSVSWLSSTPLRCSRNGSRATISAHSVRRNRQRPGLSLPQPRA